MNTEKEIFSFHYTLKDSAGKVIDSSEGQDPLPFLAGSKQILPALEEEIVQMKPGEKKNVRLSAEQGYGVRREELIVRVPREKLSDGNIRVGDCFRASQDGPVFEVRELTETEAVLDGNHPLAGADLFFEILLAEVRPASPEEVQHGHSFEPGSDGGSCGCSH